MSAPGSQKCSWWDEQEGVEVINTAALSEYFMDHIQLSDCAELTPKHFPQFVQFLHTEYPDMEVLAWALWTDVGGC